MSTLNKGKFTDECSSIQDNINIALGIVCKNRPWNGSWEIKFGRTKHAQDFVSIPNSMHTYLKVPQNAVSLLPKKIHKNPAHIYLEVSSSPI